LSISYEFPEVYVEGVSGDYYIVYSNGVYSFSSEPVGEKYYGHILYEDIIREAIDLVKAVSTREFIVVPRYKREGDLEALRVSRDARLCIMEVAGVQPIVFLSEGDIVEEGDKIAYIITGKSEVRVYKSLCSGIVVLVVNITWEKPEKYIVVVVKQDDVRRIIIKRS